MTIGQGINFATPLFPLRAAGVLKRKIAKVRKAFVHQVEECALLITGFQKEPKIMAPLGFPIRLILHTCAINGPEIIRIPQQILLKKRQMNSKWYRWKNENMFNKQSHTPFLSP